MDVGIVANPASGKDIRRLSAGASVFSNQEKQAIIKRCMRGLIGVCRPKIKYFADSHHITSSAVQELELCNTAEPLEIELEGNADDSMRAAKGLRGCGLVISLGGDGTNRALAKGWSDIPLIAISTGTNNAFPSILEATSAGFAAGVIASGLVALNEVSTQTKVIEIELSGNPGAKDLALVDAVTTTDQFVGSRAITDPARFRLALVTEANPAKPGLAGIAGCIRRVDRKEAAGLLINFEGQGRSEVIAPIAPGLVAPVAFSSVRRVEVGTPISIRGPFTLALDGERELTLGNQEELKMTIRRSGPRLIDVDQTLRVASDRGLFCNPSIDRD